MSKNPKRNASQTRADRFSQMSKQEEIIAEKKRLIEAKLKMMETDNITSSSQVALDNKLDQISGKPSLVNSFSNDGSFLEKFKKISNPVSNEPVPTKGNAEKKQSKNFNNNANRSNNHNRWNNNKNDNQRSHRNNNQRDYNDRRQQVENVQQDSFNFGYSGNTRFQENNYQGGMYGNMNNATNYQNSTQDPYMSQMNSSQQYSIIANERNNWNNSYNGEQRSNVNPQTHANMSQPPPRINHAPPSILQSTDIHQRPPGMPSMQSNISQSVSMHQAPPVTSQLNSTAVPPGLPHVRMSQPPPLLPPGVSQTHPVIPSLTSLVIPPPTGIQLNPSNNTQVPPPPLHPQMPMSMSLQQNVQIQPLTSNAQIKASVQSPLQIQSPIQTNTQAQTLIQTNIQIPPPMTLHSIPEPQPLDAMTIPRPAPLNLLSIPPPLPLCLNQIPQPKDIDVRNIPPPQQMNVSGIKMPDSTPLFPVKSKVLSTDDPMFQIDGSNDQCDRKQNPGSNPIERVAKLVVEIGDGYEEIFKQKHQHEPEFWFLFNPESAEYTEYKDLVKKLKEDKPNQCYSPEELYEPEYSLNDDEEDEQDVKIKIEKCSPKKEQISLVSQFYDDVNDQNSIEGDTKVKVEKTEDSIDSEENKRKRKRKSRWGSEKDIKPVLPAPNVVHVPSLGIALPPDVAPLTVPAPKISINKVTRTDKALLQYAKNTFGTTDLSEEDWVKAEDHFKINLLYQEMLRKRKELDQLAKSGKHKYEYDSDEEVEGGTWEHKLRSQEMEATQKWAEELTKKSEGKHHIGDFLPPEELKKFMEKYSAAKNGREPDISDYKEYKLNENNVGFQMLQKLGWKDGEGLGSSGSGIVEPINKAPNHENNQGLGIDRPENLQSDDNEYDAYRKRMMLAYRFRPNPLNNPRRPYY